MAVCSQNEWGKLHLPDSTQETHKIPNVNNKTELVKGRASKEEQGKKKGIKKKKKQLLQEFQGLSSGASGSCGSEDAAALECL
jgi:hypothetical protein